MNHNDLLSLYTHTEHFDDEHFIIKTFEIYATFDHTAGCTRIAIVNADSRHKYMIYLDYIQPVKEFLIEAAEALIKTRLLL